MLLVSGSVFAQESSVLATGNWYKLAVTKSGIYQIDSKLLGEMGIDISGLNPDRIQIYGNGGRLLPQRNNLPRPQDLIQNAIQVKGEADGRFDASDVIFFYAEGPATVRYDSLNKSLTHQVHTYSDTSYYFLSIGDNKGLRVTNQESLPQTSGNLTTQFDDYWFHESETVNLLRSGREWWGEYLGNSSGFEIQANFPGLVPSSEMTLFTSAIAAAQVPTRMLWQVNGQNAGESKMGTVVKNQYDLYGVYDSKGVRTDDVFKLRAQGTGAVTMRVNYDKSGQSSAQAYLNFIALQVKRELRPVAGMQQIYRFLPGAADAVTYQLKDISAGWRWWNITEPHRAKLAVVGNDGIFSENSGKLFRQFVGFDDAHAFKPASWQKLQNQNIRQAEPSDLLIISSREMLGEAERLAAYRRSHDKLDVSVVTTDQVYNEFASGMTDVTALRDYIRHMYLTYPEKLKYVLLLGDATYDYRNKLQNQSQLQKNVWVPVYESRESLIPVYTYSSDDYFGMMGEADGDWVESNSGDHLLQIGIGRLPVKSASEARVVVDKLINYDSSTSLGKWRNTIHFVADDGDGGIHQKHADLLATQVQEEFLSSRIFLDAFPQTTTEYGQKVPSVNKAIQSCISDGTLVLNYTGHGGTSGWAEEQVLTMGEMQSARGYNNLPLLLTATCDFGRFDDPGLVSGGELMVLSPRGGAVGALGTTRPVFSSTNFVINQAFYQAMVALGSSARLGDILKMTKNKSLTGSLNRNFTLLGDPSMRLGRGQQRIGWLETPDTLRALQKVLLKGAIFAGTEGQPDIDFNGTATVTIYDKQSSFKTLGDNQGTPTTYSEFRSKLFEGLVTVRNGIFTCQFVMPKDIDYRMGVGRVSVYAVRQDSLSDASGQLNVVIGGGVDVQEDRKPPEISGYIHTPLFRNGDVVPASSLLFLQLADENGINISRTGIGHDIRMTINDTLTVALNDYYVANTDQYNGGTIRYPFENLPSGNYTIRIKVWDTHNNSSEIAFGFQVGSGSGIQMTSYKVYPNPFDKEFSFEINHNRDNEDIEVELQVFLKTGQQLLSLQWQYYNSEPIIRETIPSLHLDSLNFSAYSYLYSLQIRSMKDNSVARRTGKLLRIP